MVQEAFMKGVDLADLGQATQFALWGFRSCAMGQSRCCCLFRQFDHVFGADCGRAVFGEVLRLAEGLGNQGGRRLVLGRPTSQRMTYDEASIVAALAAAQRGDTGLRDAHLTWLLAKPPDASLSATVSRIADACSLAGMRIVMPEEMPRPAKPEAGFLRRVAMGQQ